MSKLSHRAQSESTNAGCHHAEDRLFLNVTLTAALLHPCCRGATAVANNTKRFTDPFVYYIGQQTIKSFTIFLVYANNFWWLWNA